MVWDGGKTVLLLLESTLLKHPSDLSDDNTLALVLHGDTIKQRARATGIHE